MDNTISDIDFIEFGGESPENYEQKCLCVLVLDVSGSMAGQKIDQLNVGLKAFQQEVLNDFVAANRVETAIVTFSSSINVVQQPALLANIEMPTLTTSGLTKLVDGVRMGINLIEERKNWYRSTGQTYFRPWIFLITDGGPDADQDMKGLATEIKSKVAAKNFMFYAVGVSGYNRQQLSIICEGASAPPIALDQMKFKELFKWLSNSISIVTKSSEGEKISLPSIDGWSQIEI